MIYKLLTPIKTIINAFLLLFAALWMIFALITSLPVYIIFIPGRELYYLLTTGDMSDNDPQFDIRNYVVFTFIFFAIGFNVFTKWMIYSSGK